MLQTLGYSVASFTSSIEALEEFENNQYEYDLVITDQTMPEITGDVLVQKFKEIRPDIPIILCTGFSAKIDKQRAEEIGAARFLLKPVSVRELGQIVEEVLSERG